MTISEEEFRRVGDSHQAAFERAEHPDLIGGTEPVLGRAEQPEIVVAVTLERQDRVHDVSESLWAGDVALLGDVPDEHHWHPEPLGRRHQTLGALSYLHDAARGRTDRCVAERLDGVDHAQRRPDGVEVDEHVGEGIARREQYLRMQGSDSFGPKPNLASGLLTGHVQARPPGSGRCSEELENERGLADPRFAGEQRHAARNQAATEHPIELIDATGDGTTIEQGDIGHGHQGRRRSFGLRCGRWRLEFL